MWCYLVCASPSPRPETLKSIGYEATMSEGLGDPPVPSTVVAINAGDLPR